MIAVNWQRHQATSVDDIGPADIEAVLAASDDVDSEIEFDLGEAWNEPFDPTEDDPIERGPEFPLCFR